MTGRVQGVGFRWWVQRRANDLGVRGLVRNAPDGSVQIEMAGEPEALDRLRRMLYDGPPAARVTAVEETQAATPPPASLPAAFEIGF